MRGSASTTAKLLIKLVLSSSVASRTLKSASTDLDTMPINLDMSCSL